MNNEKRKRVRTVIDIIQKCSDDIETIRDMEQDALDNIPENFQDSDRYANIEEAVGHLEDAESALEEAIQNLEEAVS